MARLFDGTWWESVLGGQSACLLGCVRGVRSALRSGGWQLGKGAVWAPDGAWIPGSGWPVLVGQYRKVRLARTMLSAATTLTVFFLVRVLFGHPTGVAAAALLAVYPPQTDPAFSTAAVGSTEATASSVTCSQAGLPVHVNDS